ncbi:hypothetical protein [Actinophytocola sp.]|uniref:hypothetical protein n=1 Tax=Actinophytocola sp. TaxID=1872138 RepID=UPI002ED38F08
MRKHLTSAHRTPWTRTRRRHAHHGSGVTEFEQRAAAAWIRAADAGVIDVDELGWLLDKLHELASPTEVPTASDDHRPQR